LVSSKAARQQRNAMKVFWPCGGPHCAERIELGGAETASSTHLISCRQTMSGEPLLSQIREMLDPDGGPN